MKRGILLPVFSLPNKYGIGSLGKEAYEFVDFLAQTGNSYWQVLPLNPTSYGDSPYQSQSAYAGNPYFIDLDIIKEKGLLTETECAAEYSAANKIDYTALYNSRYKILEKAYKTFSTKPPQSFFEFAEKNSQWLIPYCSYMILKYKHGGKPWTEWNEYKRYKKLENYSTLNFWSFIQYQFFTQWEELKDYANAKGIKIIGDMPIYVSMDSADVWCAPQYFQLSQNFIPEKVSGVPPDCFSPDGQLWGNPLYRWEVMEKDNFSWFANRFKHMFEMFDIVRIDHFRGFSAYYSIDYGEKTARKGEWVTATGEKLFSLINIKFPNAQVIAEDLGNIDDNVKSLLDMTGYPGMRIAQFGFYQKDSTHLPERYPSNCIAYTGTHDNMTARQWAKSLPKKTLRYFRKKVKKGVFEKDSYALIRSVLESKALIAIIPIQDYLNIGQKGRINTPSTMGNNWKWRLKPNYKKIEHKIANIKKVFN